MPTMRYNDSKIQCELTLSPRVNVTSAWCLDIIGLHIYEREQEAQLLLGDRATRKHAKDS